MQKTNQKNLMQLLQDHFQNNKSFLNLPIKSTIPQTAPIRENRELVINLIILKNYY